nr:RNA-directed DNA polymerase, eukaryota [Tanacetum cinerariifolium]
DSSLSYPPGFTPEVSRQENDHRGVDLNTETYKVNSPLVHMKVMNNSQKVHENVTSNGESAFNYSHNAHNRGSILEVLDDMIQMDKVNHMDVKFIWGNSNYQYVSSDSTGSSGGILCVWEATIFKKDYATVFDNFIAIYGTWISNNSKVLIVVIYAPKSLSHKRILWDYISSLAHHTMIKSSNRETPFSLTYGIKAVIPVEIGMPTLRTTKVGMIKNDEALEINLDLLEEKREVRNTNFNLGDLVYRSNEASYTKDEGKLGTKWEGPYEVMKDLGKGAYKLKYCNENVLPRT